MSKFDGYKPFVVVKNAINKLESQALLKLVGEKDQIVESITNDLLEAGILREFLKIDRPYPTNIHHTLEEFITDGGRVVFIQNMEFDANQRTFKLDLQFDPESDRIDKTLIFRDVQNFKESLDEDEELDSDYIDSIIGLGQYSTKYVLTTDAREIIFSSQGIPKILSIKQGEGV